MNMDVVRGLRRTDELAAAGNTDEEIAAELELPARQMTSPDGLGDQAPSRIAPSVS